MNKEKIFLCITKSAPWGGAQKYVYDIATAAQKEGLDLTVLLGGDGELKKRLDDAGVPTMRLLNSQRDIETKKELGLFFELFKLFKKERPGVIHLNSSKMGLMGAFVGRITGVKKIIFISHGWAFNEERPWYQKIFFRILHIVTILLSHKTIAVSEITKSQIGWPWDKKITIIRNGVRKIDFLNKKEARKFLGEKIGRNIDDTTWIGTISELHKTKGLKYALEAIERIQEKVVFIIIGDGHDRKNTEDMIAKMNLGEKVFLTGRIESASNYIKAFDIVTLTSITEGLPYALLEAGSAGVPIIASKVGGIPEIIGDNETGILCRPRHASDIVRAIEFLLKNPEKSKIFGGNLKKKIETEFTIEGMLEKTFALYRI